MLVDALRLHQFNLGLLNRLCADLTDADLARSLGPDHHNGHWVLGHLAIAADYALMFVTGSGALPKEWHNAFGPGSKPSDPLPVNEKAALLRAIAEGHVRVAAAVDALKGDLAMLEVPHGLAWFEGTALKTKRDVVGQLLTTHAGFHTGQMSVYRRAAGKPAMF